MTPAASPAREPRPQTWLQQAQQSWRSMISWTSSEFTSEDQPPQPKRKASVLTNQNQQTNDPWGENLAAKPPNCTRIHIQNVNGFTLDSRGGQFDQYCSIHQELQADISCGQEHKLDTTQMQVRSVLYDTAHRHWE